MNWNVSSRAESRDGRSGSKTRRRAIRCKSSPETAPGFPQLSLTRNAVPAPKVGWLLYGPLPNKRSFGLIGRRIHLRVESSPDAFDYHLAFGRILTVEGIGNVPREIS